MAKDKKKKSKDKLSHDTWEHDEKQAEVRQKVEKVQGFDDAIASRLEQESFGEGIKKGAAGALFKRLDENKECATRMPAATVSSCTLGCTLRCLLFRCCQRARGSAAESCVSVSRLSCVPCVVAN